MTLPELLKQAKPGDYFRRRFWPPEWYARLEPDGGLWVYGRNDYCFGQDAESEDWEFMLPC